MSQPGQNLTQFELSYPVTVEAALSMSLTFENLKIILDFILEVLRRHDKQFEDLQNNSQFDNILRAYDNKMNDLQNQVADLRDKNQKAIENDNSNQKQLGEVKQQLSELSKQVPNNFNPHLLDSLSTQIQDQQKQINNCLKDIQDFEKDQKRQDENLIADGKNVQQMNNEINYIKNLLLNQNFQLGNSALAPGSLQTIQPRQGIEVGPTDNTQQRQGLAKAQTPLSSQNIQSINNPSLGGQAVTLPYLNQDIPFNTSQLTAGQEGPLSQSQLAAGQGVPASSSQLPGRQGGPYTQYQLATGQGNPLNINQLQNSEGIQPQHIYQGALSGNQPANQGNLSSINNQGPSNVGPSQQPFNPAGSNIQATAHPYNQGPPYPIQNQGQPQFSTQLSTGQANPLNLVQNQRAIDPQNQANIPNPIYQDSRRQTDPNFPPQQTFYTAPNLEQSAALNNLKLYPSGNESAIPAKNQNKGSYHDENSGLVFDPKTNAWLDQSGTPINPRTKEVIDLATGFPIDEKFNLPRDPISQNYVDQNKYPIDPQTRQYINPVDGLKIDPVTGTYKDPQTGYSVDPRLGRLFDPETQQYISKDTNKPIDASQLFPYNPILQAYIDPLSGTAIVPNLDYTDDQSGITDPVTNLPIKSLDRIQDRKNRNASFASNPLKKSRLNSILVGRPYVPETGHYAKPGKNQEELEKQSSGTHSQKSSMDMSNKSRKSIQGYYTDSQNNLRFDPNTRNWTNMDGEPVHPKTLEKIDLNTGFPIDPIYNLPRDPISGTYVNAQKVPIDPVTKQPIDITANLNYDPVSNTYTDPVTGFAVEPTLGRLYNKDTDQYISPETLQPIDSSQLLPFDPIRQAYMDPWTGLAIVPNIDNVIQPDGSAVDAITNFPIDSLHRIKESEQESDPLSLVKLRQRANSYFIKPFSNIGADSQNLQQGGLDQTPDIFSGLMYVPETGIAIEPQSIKKLPKFEQNEQLKNILQNPQDIVGNYIDPDSNLQFDPDQHVWKDNQGNPIHPVTKQKIDPETGFPIDQSNNLPRDPVSGNFVNRNKQPINPETKQVIDPMQNLKYDPQQKAYIDPESGFAVEPNLGRLYDPNTGQLISTQTKKPIDASVLFPYDPIRNAYIDPLTGMGVTPTLQNNEKIDPNIVLPLEQLDQYLDQIPLNDQNVVNPYTRRHSRKPLTGEMYVPNTGLKINPKDIKQLDPTKAAEQSPNAAVQQELFKHPTLDLKFDPSKNQWLDNQNKPVILQTMQPADPVTGFPIDAQFNLPKDPVSGNYINQQGQPIDPRTHQPIDPTKDCIYDQETNQYIDPTTNLAVEPNLGRKYIPLTGQLVSSDTNQPIDASVHFPYNPILKAYVDPWSGLAVAPDVQKLAVDNGKAIDPVTNLPLDSIEQFNELRPSIVKKQKPPKGRNSYMLKSPADVEEVLPGQLYAPETGIIAYPSEVQRDNRQLTSDQAPNVNGYYIDQQSGFTFDPQQQNWVDTTGQPVNPLTLEQLDPISNFPIDPKYNLPRDPISGNYINTEGQIIDPKTKKQIHPVDGLPRDPETGVFYDPSTGFAVEPSLGRLYDPETGQLISKDDLNPIDGSKLFPYNPIKQAYIDPWTGLAVSPDIRNLDNSDGIPKDLTTNLPITSLSRINQGSDLDDQDKSPKYNKTSKPKQDIKNQRPQHSQKPSQDSQVNQNRVPNVRRRSTKLSDMIDAEPVQGRIYAPDTGEYINPKDLAITKPKRQRAKSGSISGFYVNPSNGLRFDPNSEQWIDDDNRPVLPQTGQQVDVNTGFPINPDFNLPQDPISGNFVDSDGNPIDPHTRQVIDPIKNAIYNPEKEMFIDPETGFAIEPTLGRLYDPETNQFIDRDTGEPIDASQVLPYNPIQQAYVDPWSGLGIVPDLTSLPVDGLNYLDPLTNLPISSVQRLKDVPENLDYSQDYDKFSSKPSKNKSQASEDDPINQKPQNMAIKPQNKNPRKRRTISLMSQASQGNRSDTNAPINTPARLPGRLYNPETGEYTGIPNITQNLPSSLVKEDSKGVPPGKQEDHRTDRSKKQPNLSKGQQPKQQENQGSAKLNNSNTPQFHSTSRSGSYPKFSTGSPSLDIQIDPAQALQFDPNTQQWVDINGNPVLPQTGQRIDPITGFPIDPLYNLPRDPISEHFVNPSRQPIDPITGQVINPVEKARYDPETDQYIDQNTGNAIDPHTGRIFNPKTQQFISPSTNQPIEASEVFAYNPLRQAYIDPLSGIAIVPNIQKLPSQEGVPVDPVTALPINSLSRLDSNQSNISESSDSESNQPSSKGSSRKPEAPQKQRGQRKRPTRNYTKPKPKAKKSNVQNAANPSKDYSSIPNTGQAYDPETGRYVSPADLVKQTQNRIFNPNETFSTPTYLDPSATQNFLPQQPANQYFIFPQQYQPANKSPQFQQTPWNANPIQGNIGGQNDKTNNPSPYNLNDPNSQKSTHPTNYIQEPGTGMYVDPNSGQQIDPTKQQSTSPITNYQFDPSTGLLKDPITGNLVDPRTGQQFQPMVMQPNYNLSQNQPIGLVQDPKTGNLVDPRNGRQFDTQTGLPIDPVTGNLIDPNTGQNIDPKTKHYIDGNTKLPIDPETGFPYDPVTGWSYDPKTKEPFDPKTMKQINPKTGRLTNQQTKATPIQKYSSPGYVPQEQRFDSKPFINNLGPAHYSGQPIENSNLGDQSNAQIPQNVYDRNKRPSQQNLQVQTGPNSQQPYQIQQSLVGDENQRLDHIENKYNELQQALSTLKHSHENTKAKTDNNSEKLDKQQTSLSDLVKRVTRLEKTSKILEELSNSTYVQSQKNQQDIALLQKLLKELQQSLRGKVDTEDFDYIRTLFTTMNNPDEAVPIVSSGLPTKDLNLIKELQQKYDALQEALNGMGKINPQAIQDLITRVNIIEQQLTLKADEADIIELHEHISTLKSEIQRLENWIRELENRQFTTNLRIEDATPSPLLPGDSKRSSADLGKVNSLARRLAMLEDLIRGFNIPNGADLGKLFEDVKQLQEVLKELRVNLDKLWREFQTRMKIVDDQLKDKSQLQQALGDLESTFNKKLNELNDMLAKRFADKNDTRKALKYLERMIRDYLEGVKMKAEGDDAMFAKKPLGGWSCASCETNLETLIGRRAEYQPWRKVPYRDPADRLARVGPGFSRMLANVQADSVSNRSRVSPLRSLSPLTTTMAVDMKEDNEMINLPPVRAAEYPYTSR